MDSPTQRQDTPDEIEERHERAGMYLAALALFTVPILIIGAMVSTRTTDAESVAPLEPDTRSGLDSLEVEASEITIDEPSGSSPENSSTGTGDNATSQPVADSPVEQFPAIPTNAIGVAVYNQATDDPGTFSFAIRLTSESASPELGTDIFTIAVVNDAEESVPSISRFEHDTLPPGSSALALVRAENVGSGDHYVVVRVGETELDRAIIEPAE